MRKIIAIGESMLDTLFSNGAPVKSHVAGRIANASASLASARLPVSMVSECGADSVGDLIIDFLTARHVDVKSVDRFTDGSTALSMIFEWAGGGNTMVRYGSYPAFRFDVVWPRIDAGDIVVFGSLYAIDPPQRQRLFELVSYARERGALIVYLPGFQHGMSYRLTKVMTAILENLEISDIVVAHDSDLDDIFPGESPEEAFHNHIEFYCSTYVHLHRDMSLTLYSGKRREHFASPVSSCPQGNMLGWQSGIVGGIVFQLMCMGIGCGQLPALDRHTMQAMADCAFHWADCCAKASDNCLPLDVAHCEYRRYCESELNRENDHDNSKTSNLTPTV